MVVLEGVSKSYGDEVALRHLDLEVVDGEFFCLLGPSGCGKTTTLNLIGGFVAPSTGAIWISGQRVDRLPPNKRSVNTVFQSYALFPHMTVGQNVAFGLRMAGVRSSDRAARVTEALAIVGLESVGKRMPGELSGGQQQRVALARALVNRPDVLLLDEPLGALDLKLRRRLQIELLQIHDEVGTTFIYVTHDQEEAMSMADRIAVLNEGRVEQIGAPDEIYRRPTTRFVAGFIGESNFVEAGLLPPALSAGTRTGTLMIRPEAVQLSVNGVGPDHAVRGTIAQVLFLGDHTRVAVQCDLGDQPLVASIADEQLATAPLQPGVEIELWWEQQHVVSVA